jgi:histidinol phosphatase-like enzyme/8-oxo-dGTP pyrophosphatase MutT (NUDIX family)
MHAEAKVKRPGAQSPDVVRNDPKIITGTGGNPIKASNANLVAGIQDPRRYTFGSMAVGDETELHPGNPHTFAAGRLKIAADLVWFQAQRDLSWFKGAQEAEPKRQTHGSAPKQQLRPRAEIIVFDDYGCYAIDKDDYVLFPGGGVDDGEPADFAAHREAIEEADLHPLNVEARGVVETMWPRGVSKFQDDSDFDGERTYFFTGIDGGRLGTKHPDREHFTVLQFDELEARLAALIRDPEQAWAKRNNETRLEIVEEAHKRAQLGWTFLRRKYAAEALPKARGWSHHRRALKRVFAPRDPDAFIKAINEIERRIGHDVFDAVRFGDDRVLLILRTPDVGDATHHDHNLGREINELAKTAGVEVSGSMTSTLDAEVAGGAPGLLVDRDGTCVESEFNDDATPKGQTVRPGVAEVLTAYRGAGVRIIGITNRFADPDGVGADATTVQRFNEHTLELLPQLTDILYCPDLDDAGRKPSPAMLHYAAERYELQDIIGMVGNSSDDRGAAEAAEVPYFDAEEFFGDDGTAIAVLKAHGLHEGDEAPEKLKKQADAAKFVPKSEYYYTNERGEVLAQRLPDRRFAFPEHGKGKRAPYSNPFRYIPDEGVPDSGAHGYEYGFNVGEGDAPSDFQGEWIPGKEILSQTYGSMGLARNRRYHGLDRSRARVLQRLLAKHLSRTTLPTPPAATELS